jgi:hypothetical protein
MRKIAVAKLSEVLKRIRGATAVSLVVETSPELIKPKSNPLFGRLTKLSYLNGMIGFNYESSVNRQQGREGGDMDFEAMPRKWGTRIAGSPFVEYKGKLYLETKVQKVYGTKYILDGKEVTKDEIKKWLRPKPEEGARQGVENPVVLRDFSLESIREIRVDGEVFALDKR